MSRSSRGSSPRLGQCFGNLPRASSRFDPSYGDLRSTICKRSTLLLNLTHVTKAPPEQDACHRGYPASRGAASWDPYCSAAARRRRHLVRTRLNQVDERGGMERVLDDQAAVVTYEEMQRQARISRRFHVERDYEHSGSLANDTGSPTACEGEQDCGSHDQERRRSHRQRLPVTGSCQLRLGQSAGMSLERIAHPVVGHFLGDWCRSVN